MTMRVFIDGAAGTTGLEIRERLAGRRDLQLVTLPEARRKEAEARREALNEADVVILCLPDDAAREAVALIDNPATRVIDASTAYRTDPAWVYGFPEVEPDRAGEIARATRVSNPGCYPTGFLALVRPLVRAGLLPADRQLTVNAVSGYSGGGKAMIADFERPDAPAYQIYGLTLAHKHVPEMQAHAGLSRPPLFAPAVAAAYRGMLVEVPLVLDDIDAAHRALEDAYRGSAIVRVLPADAAPGILTLDSCADTDRLDIRLFANAGTGHVRLVAALDNLGKGAAGAAVQNLNLMIGADEATGLRL